MYTGRYIAWLFPVSTPVSKRAEIYPRRRCVDVSKAAYGLLYRKMAGNYEFEPRCWSIRELSRISLPGGLDDP